MQAASRQAESTMMPPESSKTATPAIQTPTLSGYTRRRIRARIRTRKVLHALFSLGGVALALLVFWPKVNIAMAPRDDAVVWLYTIRNDSFLSIYDVTKDNNVAFEVRPCIDEFKLAIGSETKSDCAAEKVAIVRPGDEHTFKCLVPTFVPPTDQIGGSVQLRAHYRYLGILNLSTTACFEYAPKSDGSPRYLRRACSTPARTSTSPPC